MRALLFFFVLALRECSCQGGVLGGTSPNGGTGQGGDNGEAIGKMEKTIKDNVGNLTNTIANVSSAAIKVVEDVMQNLTLWKDYPTQLNENFHMVMDTITPLVTPIRIFLIIICILLSLLVLRCAWVAFMEVVDGFRTYCMPRSVVVEPPPFDLEAAHFDAPPFLDDVADCSPLCQEPACCCEEECPGATGDQCCGDDCGYENPCWREKQCCSNEQTCSSKDTKRMPAPVSIYRWLVRVKEGLAFVGGSTDKEEPADQITSWQWSSEVVAVEMNAFGEPKKKFVRDALGQVYRLVGTFSEYRLNYFRTTYTFVCKFAEGFEDNWQQIVADEWRSMQQQARDGRALVLAPPPPPVQSLIIQLIDNDGNPVHDVTDPPDAPERATGVPAAGVAGVDEDDRAEGNGGEDDIEEGEIIDDDDSAEIQVIGNVRAPVGRGRVEDAGGSSGRVGGGGGRAAAAADADTRRGAGARFRVSRSDWHWARYSLPDPHSVLIFYLPPDSTIPDIHRIFRPLQVMDCARGIDNQRFATGEFRVHFGSRRDVADALKKNDSIVGGRRVRVRAIEKKNDGRSLKYSRMH